MRLRRFSRRFPGFRSLPIGRRIRRGKNPAQFPSNPDSLPENRITTLLEDREGNIWVGLGATQPTFFMPRPPPFKSLPFDSGKSQRRVMH